MASAVERSPAARASPQPSSSTDTEESDIGQVLRGLDIDELSSDDEAGVFFGSHAAIERKFVAALSRKLPRSPVSFSPSTSPTSSFPGRIKKRDSREFLRRKTLLLSHTPDRTADKVWEGGFFERPADGQEVEAGPSLSSSGSSAEGGFSLEIELPQLGDDSNEQQVVTEDEDEYDKENLEVQEWNEDDLDDEEMITRTPNFGPVTIGYREDQLSHDMCTQLDMGSLSLFDIDDPEPGPVEHGNEAGGVSFSPSFSDWEAGPSSPHEHQPPRQEHWGTPQNLDMLSNTLPFPRRDSEQSMPPSSRATRIATPEVSRNLIDLDSSWMSDMDSPVARAPVVIPIWKIASPPPSMSPLRGLEPGPSHDFDFQEQPAQAAVTLPSLESPQEGMTNHPALTPTRLTAHSPLTPSRLPMTTPMTQHDLISSVLGYSSRPNKVLKTSASQAAPLSLSQRHQSRVEVTKAQLDSVFKHSRSVPAVHQPSASAPQRPLQESKPVVQRLRAVAASHDTFKNENAKTASPGKVVKFAVPKQSPPSKGVNGKALPKGLPRPVKPLGTSSSASVNSSLPRPALRKPASVPNLAANRLPGSKLSTARPTLSSSLKRPFSATQSTSARPAQSAQRPTLGLPVRPPPGSVQRSSTLNGLPDRASVLSNPVRSPVSSLSPSKRPFAMLSPSKPTLGKPMRQTGMTPSSQRTLTIGFNRALTTPQSLSAQRMKSGTPSRTPHFDPPRPLALKRLSEEKVSTCDKSESPSPKNDEQTATNGDDGNTQEETAKESNSNGDVELANSESTTANSADQTSKPTAPVGQIVSDSDDSQEDSSAQRRMETRSSPRTSPRNSPKRKAKSEPPADEPSRRSKRAVKAPARLTSEPPKPRTKKEAAVSIVPGLTEKQLEEITKRNTKRNEVFLCSIDRQIVQVPGPRPPSPKIRTAAEREEEERKANREARARRRKSEVDEPASPPDIETIQTREAPGDEDEYRTPERPAKKAKMEEKPYVHWDRGLTVIRSDLGSPRHHPGQTPKRPAIKNDVKLDEQGNVVDRPIAKLKRSQVVVRAMFYDGEAPLPFSYNKKSRGRSSKKA